LPKNKIVFATVLSVGLLLQGFGCATLNYLSDHPSGSFPPSFFIFGGILMVLGTGLAAYLLRLHSISRGTSGWWCVVAFLSIYGIVIYMVHNYYRRVNRLERAVKQQEIIVAQMQESRPQRRSRLWAGVGVVILLAGARYLFRLLRGSG